MKLDIVAVAYRLVDRYGEDLVLRFSQYLYRPRSLFDERREFSCRGNDVTAIWLEQKLSELPAGWDLALNSLVERRRGKLFHIPMVDFSCSDFSLIQSTEVKELIGRDIFDEMIFFDSGRSFHGYSTELIGRKRWIEFMGRLLLLNAPNSKAIVDSRWVGHRLIGGYSALRWSANSPHYIHEPLRVSDLGEVLNR